MADREYEDRLRIIENRRRAHESKRSVLDPALAEMLVDIVLDAAMITPGRIREQTKEAALERWACLMNIEFELLEAL